MILTLTNHAGALDCALQDYDDFEGVDITVNVRLRQPPKWRLFVDFMMHYLYGTAFHIKK